MNLILYIIRVDDMFLLLKACELSQDVVPAVEHTIFDFHNYLSIDDAQSDLCNWILDNSSVSSYQYFVQVA